MGPLRNKKQGGLLVLAALGFAALVVLAVAGMAALRLGGSAKLAAGQGDLYLALDMDVTNGSGPCEPVDDYAQRALGESYQVAICAGGLQQSVAVFSTTVLYDRALNVVPDVSCSAGDCPDDNPDANAGATTWGDGLGEGWSCNILGKAEPEGDRAGGGEAFIACLSGAGPYRLGDNETSGVMAVISFHAVGAGVDNLSFGGPAENTLGDARGVEMGTCFASKNIPCYGGTVSISMTPAPSPTPTTTPTPTPTSTPSAPTPDPNLVAHWKLDEGSGTAASDSSGNGNAGALYGPTWVAGRDGYALHFDGTDDYVEVPDDDTLDLTTGATVAAWVRVDGTTGYVQELVSKWFACPGDWNSAWAFEMESNGVTAGWGTTTGTGFDMLLSNSTVPLGTWFHYAATFDGSVKKIYINGQETASRAVPGTLRTNSNPLQLGRNAYDTCYPEQRYWFKGTLDEVKIYDRALTEEEIRTQAGVVPTLTPTPGPGGAVGGIAEAPDVDESSHGSSPPYSAIAGAAVGAILLAVLGRRAWSWL